MPHTICLDKYDIARTRSQHEDTNYIIATLTVDGQLVGEPKSRFMGNQNNGTFSVGFCWPDLVVQREAVLNYLIINKGHGNPSELQQALVQAAQTASVAGGSVLQKLVDLGFNLVFANCDGPITPPEGRTIVWHPFELDPVPPGTKAEEVVNESGNDSPAGCGGNSHYRVHVSVSAA
jgi:hypothetical protein